MTTKERAATYLLWTILVAGRVLAALVLLLPWPAHALGKSFGQALYDSGYRTTVAVSDRGFDPTAPPEARLVRGNFDWTKPADLSLTGRYGFPQHTKGPVVGPENVTAAGLTTALSCPGLPERLGLPVGYVADELDRSDAMYVAANSDPKGSYWNVWVIPAIDHCSGPTPPPNNCPACPVCPSCPPPPACPPPVTCPPACTSSPLPASVIADQRKVLTFLGPRQRPYGQRVLDWLLAYQPCPASNGKLSTEVRP